ncbi:Origin recognition complex, subunit 1 [Dimargaris cristalligena]|nr:Origin recognition complex, subunit 1 [Dimargaris cristalligena]
MAATANALRLAREQLHVSAVPDSLPGREGEFQDILGHLETAIRDKVGTCIYISGVPGTGKTATVREVIEHLANASKQKKGSKFKYVEINGMKLTEPAQSYSLLYHFLTGEKATHKHAADLLEKHFQNPNDNSEPCVVLMDELDLLVTRKQTIMYNFFEWPNRANSRLIVIAIANTMDLPERVLSNKVSSRLGLTRINFQPYTHQQLFKIVESRLIGLGAFDSDAIELCARKVSSVSGDARRALDICRRAIEVVEDNADQNLEAPAQVTMNIIDRVVKEMTSSGNTLFVKHASTHQKLFLVALRNQLQKVGLPETSFHSVAHHHIQLCRLHNLEIPTSSVLLAICSALGAARCLLAESSRLDVHQKIRLNISDSDLVAALKPDSFFRAMVA